MANKLLDRHTRLTKAIELLEKQLSQAETGIDAKEKRLNYIKWKDKWNKERTKELSKVLSENNIGLGEAFVGETESKALIGGLVKSTLNIGDRWRDPKETLKAMKEQQAFLEKNLGQKYARNVADISGITGGGPLRSQLLMRDRPNPFYVRKFDKEVFWKERELSIQAQNKFRMENKDNWHENYDDPYKGWRQYLDESHSEHPKSVNKSPLNRALMVNASNRDNVSSISATKFRSNDTSEISRHGLTGHSKFGDQVWTGRGSGRSFHQANADTRALLIKETNNKRAVNLLSNDQLSRFRISGAFDSDKSITLIGDGRNTRIKKLSINQNY